MTIGKEQLQASPIADVEELKAHPHFYLYKNKWEQELAHWKQSLAAGFGWDREDPRIDNPEYHNARIQFLTKLLALFK